MSDTGARGEKLFAAVVEKIENDIEHWGQMSWAYAEPESSQDSIQVVHSDGSIELLHPEGLLDNYGDPILAFPAPEILDAVKFLPTSCGTSFCVAGWAVQLAGAEIAWEPEMVATIDGRKVVAALGASTCITADGTSRSVREYARELLELDDVQAYHMFKGGNSLQDIRNHGSSYYDVPQEDFSNIDDTTFPEYSDDSDHDVFYFDGLWEDEE